MLLPHFKKGTVEAGCDEAGRGCLAGPVVAAAVVLPPDYSNDILTDSKQLTEKQRYLLRDIIIKDALAWAVAFVDHQKIDEINILNASFLAMSNAVKELKIVPELLLIDGNRFKSELKIPFECIVQGDSKYLSIAAASILAKTFRDDHMDMLHKEAPQYGWGKNKGYPTKIHRMAIAQFGVHAVHRVTFQLLPKPI